MDMQSIAVAMAWLPRRRAMVPAAYPTRFRLEITNVTYTRPQVKEDETSPLFQNKPSIAGSYKSRLSFD